MGEADAVSAAAFFFFSFADRNFALSSIIIIPKVTEMIS